MASKTLDCGIIGAGIAGLGAAIALRRAGHSVEIFERSTFKNEVGAAITLTPNGNAVLEAWGFDAKRARETDKEQYRNLDAATLECKVRMDLSGVPERYGHAFNAYHRVDMHEEMRRLASGSGAEIRLGSEAVDVKCEEGTIAFKDGTTVRKDLVIIADGIKSRFVQAVTGEETPTKKTGKSVYRTLIPIDRLMADPVIRPMFEGEPSGFCSAMNPKVGVLFITYPCREDKLMNCAIFHTTKPHQVDAEDWNSPATVEDLLDVLQGFHPAWQALAKQADTMKCYTVGHRDIIPRMSNGKTVLIGDASHPMQPTHAQGGCVSLEDAAALEVLFSDWKQNDSVEKRLSLYNQLRLPRNNITQLYSNGMFYAEPFKTEDPRLRKYWSGDLLSTDAQYWSPPIQEFFYGYDAFQEAKKALMYKDEPEGLPDGVIKHFGLQTGSSSLSML